jgi:hypothetical protein
VTPAKVGRLNLGPMRQAAVTAVIVGIKPPIGCDRGLRPNLTDSLGGALFTRPRPTADVGAAEKFKFSVLAR